VKGHVHDFAALLLV